MKINKVIEEEMDCRKCGKNIRYAYKMPLVQWVNGRTLIDQYVCKECYEKYVGELDENNDD